MRTAFSRYPCHHNWWRSLDLVRTLGPRRTPPVGENYGESDKRNAVNKTKHGRGSARPTPTVSKIFCSWFVSKYALHTTGGTPCLCLFGRLIAGSVPGYFYSAVLHFRNLHVQDSRTMYAIESVLTMMSVSHRHDLQIGSHKVATDYHTHPPARSPLSPSYLV